MTMASTGREGHEKTDAILGQGVFRLMQLVDQRLVQTNGTGKCDPKLELSLMFFSRNFDVVTLASTMGCQQRLKWKR